MPDQSKTPIGTSGALTPEDMRAFTLDTLVENNMLDLDLVWSDGEIVDAMDRCRMMWDGIPPIGRSLNAPRALPRAYPFMLGTAYQMYLTTLQKYMRNDLDYTIGGVQTNTFGKRIAHFKAMLSALREEFRESATAMKESINAENAYRVFC
jgi:hypothetical protein